MKEKKKLKERGYLFPKFHLFKIVAEIFSTDNIPVAKIDFEEMIKAPTKSEAFKEVRQIIKEEARRRGYPLKNRWKNGYRAQYHLITQKTLGGWRKQHI